MKWTEKRIEEAIISLANELGVERMPTNSEMRARKMSGLSRAISLNGGTLRWSEVTGLPMKKRAVRWTDDLIEGEIRKSMESLCISRMPTSSELLSIGRGDLQNAISKNRGFRYWANKLGIKSKVSETTKGQKYERIAKRVLEGKGYKVKSMSTGHPYDL